MLISSLFGLILLFMIVIIVEMLLLLLLLELVQRSWARWRMGHLLLLLLQLLNLTLLLLLLMLLLLSVMLLLNLCLHQSLLLLLLLGLLQGNGCQISCTMLTDLLMVLEWGIFQHFGLIVGWFDDFVNLGKWVDVADPFRLLFWLVSWIQRFENLAYLFVILESMLFHLGEETFKMALQLTELVPHFFIFLLRLELAHTCFDRVFDRIPESWSNWKFTNHFISDSRCRILSYVEVKWGSFPFLVICLGVRDRDIDDIFRFSLPRELLLGCLLLSLLLCCPVVIVSYRLGDLLLLLYLLLKLDLLSVAFNRVAAGCLFVILRTTGGWDMVWLLNAVVDYLL